MRIAIASRIFEPEAAAAAYRLRALADAFSQAGHDTTVLTVNPPRGSAASQQLGDTPFLIRRFPVLRDRTGYVRGYFQYLSFDLPLFFRIIFGPRRDALVIEPPPTTWMLASLAVRLRRTPYFVYAADIWSDAAESTGAPRFVVSTVRWMERFALLGARGIYAVNEGIAARIETIAPGAAVAVVGNGIDTEIFRPDGPVLQEGFLLGDREPYAIYTGTASEWQGAEIFVRAISQLHCEGIALRLVFLGQGTAFAELRKLAEELKAPVEFHDTVPPDRAAACLRGARVSLASIRPGVGYDFAYPTKVFAAWSCGIPVVYAGPGPARGVLQNHPKLGEGVEYEVPAVAEAIQRVLHSDRRSTDWIAGWARMNVSLASVGERAVRFTQNRLLDSPGAR